MTVAVSLCSRKANTGSSTMSREMLMREFCGQDSVENRTSGMFMINGHGGTGKMFLYKVVCSKL